MRKSMMSLTLRLKPWVMEISRRKKTSHPWKSRKRPRHKVTVSITRDQPLPPPPPLMLECQRLRRTPTRSHSVVPDLSLAESKTRDNSAPSSEMALTTSMMTAMSRTKSEIKDSPKQMVEVSVNLSTSVPKLALAEGAQRRTSSRLPSHWQVWSQHSEASSTWWRILTKRVTSVWR